MTDRIDQATRQDVYARIGVSTRAGAAMFAMEHGLLETKPG